MVAELTDARAAQAKIGSLALSFQVCQFEGRSVLIITHRTKSHNTTKVFTVLPFSGEGTSVGSLGCILSAPLFCACIFSLDLTYYMNSSTLYFLT